MSLFFMNSSKSLLTRFWTWTAQKRPSWREDKTEAAVLFCVFGATGSSSVYFVRPALTKLGIEGSLRDGPNSYRVISILSVTPIYATILFVLGTLSGRHAYFAAQWRKIINRFVPSSAISKIVPEKCKSVSKPSAM